jgi:protein-tyrosine phosphatase
VTDVPVEGSYWVESERLLAGPYPDGAGDIALLRAAGVDLFIDLTREDERWVAYWSDLPDGAHRRFGCWDFAAPSEEAMRRILAQLDQALRLGQTVSVHCKGGRGRTGTVIGCYLVEQGMTGFDALARLRDWARNSPETDEQKEMVRHWRRSAEP